MFYHACTLVYSYIIEQYISWELVEITGFLKLSVLSQMLYIRDGWMAERMVMGGLMGSATIILKMPSCVDRDSHNGPT